MKWKKLLKGAGNRVSSLGKWMAYSILYWRLSCTFFCAYCLKSYSIELEENIFLAFSFSWNRINKLLYMQKTVHEKLGEESYTLHFMQLVLFLLLRIINIEHVWHECNDYCDSFLEAGLLLKQMPLKCFTEDQLICKLQLSIIYPEYHLIQAGFKREYKFEDNSPFGTWIL